MNIIFEKHSIDYTENNDWFGIACGGFDETGCGNNPNHCAWDQDESACKENNTFEDIYKQQLNIDPAATLNIYTGELGGTLGYAYLPSDLASFGIPFYMDGVVLHYSVLQEINNLDYVYNEGDTGTHEVGHYLGLHHTFNGGCDDSDDGGDEVADTPEQHNGNNIYECVEGADTCPAAGVDPIHNYMNYVADNCMDEFTPGQSDRMVDMLGQFRPDLGVNNTGMVNVTFSVNMSLEGVDGDIKLRTSTVNGEYIPSDWYIMDHTGNGVYSYTLELASGDTIGYNFNNSVSNGYEDAEHIGACADGF